MLDLYTMSPPMSVKLKFTNFPNVEYVRNQHTNIRARKNVLAKVVLESRSLLLKPVKLTGFCYIAFRINFQYATRE